MTWHPWIRVGGSPEHRDWLADPNLPSHRPNVHSSATLRSFVTVDAGCTRPTHVGAGTVLMAHVHVGHDASVGERCELSPGAVICGYAEIGDDTKIGVNASVLPYVRVGENACIGAGAVVTRHVPAGETWVGNPARKLEDADRDTRLKSDRPVGQDSTAELAHGLARSAVAADWAAAASKSLSATLDLATYRGLQGI